VSRVEHRLGRNARVPPEAAITAVMRVLRQRVSMGELEHLQNVLPLELKGIVEMA
jgi:uncharacterized protein (DUF2267 family)